MRKKEKNMKEKQSLIQVISNNAGHFIALVLLIAVAFAITRFAERRARKREIDAGARPEEIFSIRKISIIGVFSAISFVLMLFEFPLPFAPAFYKFDFSDIPALIGGFAAGPLVGVMIEFIKVLLNIVIQGTTTGFVGEIANFVVGAAFVVPATVIYRFKKTRNTALISCLVGTLCIAIVGATLNAFFLLPAYAVLFGSGVDSFIAAGTATITATTADGGKKDTCTVTVTKAIPVPTVTGVDVDDYSVHLTWNPSELIDGQDVRTYTVNVYTNSFQLVDSQTGITDEFYDFNVSGPGTYRVTVTAVNGTTGATSSTASQTFTVDWVITKDWQSSSSLPAGVTPETCEIEYKHTYRTTAQSSPKR